MLAKASLIRIKYAVMQGIFCHNNRKGQFGVCITALVRTVSSSLLTLLNPCVRSSMPLSRTTGCPHPWTVPARCTSSCWTAGRRTATTGPSSAKSSTTWTRWSVIPTRWRPWPHCHLGVCWIPIYSHTEIESESILIWTNTLAGVVLLIVC